MNFRQLKTALVNSFKKDPRFFIVIALIFALGIFFRAWDHQNRINVLADNARDVQIARYAADNFKIPQVGQFSSAGPFFYGPWYYWFLTLVAFIPLGFATHWYVLSAISVVFIYLVYLVANKIGGKWLGATAALLAAISPAQINNSLNVWNPAIIPTLVVIALLLQIKYLETKKTIYFFFLSFVVFLAFTIHFQSILILPTLLVALFWDIKNIKVFAKNVLVAALGFLLAYLPMLYFDIRHNWYNTVSLIVFLTVDQYSTWVPNNWRIYLTNYWPAAWAYISGGTKYLGYAIITLLGVITLAKFKTYAKNKYLMALIITFVLEVFMFRYYRGERFQYYSFFAHPVVAILTAWLTLELFKIQKVVGVVFLAVVLFFTTQNAIIYLKPQGVSLTKINQLKEKLYREFPSETYDVYGCVFNSELTGHPLALTIYDDGRNSEKGFRVGTCLAAKGEAVIFEITPDQFFVPKQFWFQKTTSKTYRDTVEWWMTKPPGKGDLFKFLKERLRPSCWPHC